MQMLTCAPEELWICHSRRPTVRVPLLQLCRTAGPQYGIIKKKHGQSRAAQLLLCRLRRALRRVQPQASDDGQDVRSRGY